MGIVRSLPGVNRNRGKEMKNEVDRTSQRPAFQRSNREFEGRPSQEGKKKQFITIDLYFLT
jgi:hypothetical protein